MKTLSIILVVISVLTIIGGMSLAKGAPQEAVACATTCFWAILARIAQAKGQHKEVLETNQILRSLYEVSRKKKPLE